MSAISLTGTWRSLGTGPFDLQVLAGLAVVQAADRRPANIDATGLILAAEVGVDPTHCGGPGEWWAKALLGGGVTVAVLPITVSAPTQPVEGAVSVAAEGSGVAGTDLAPALIVCVANDGTLQPASSSDPAQFGMVAGFTTASAASGGRAAFTRHDIISNSAWALKPGPVFVGQHGGVTQVEPTAGFIQVAGLAVTATTIVAGFGPPTLF